MERYVPLHPTTTEALRRYARNRDALVAGRARAFLALGLKGRSATRACISLSGTSLLNLGLRTAEVHPRAHDLRHSFVVRALLKTGTGPVCT